MKNEIQNAYINALLADAVYISKNSPINAEGKDTLNGRMTSTQADFITSNFERLNSSHETGDFDVAVWRGKSGTPYAGEHYVSFRGTQEEVDFLTDADLALNSVAREQIRDMINWWLKNTTPAGEMAKQVALTPSVDPVTHATRFFMLNKEVEGTGLLDNVDSVQINGHSLGGHISAAFARLFGKQINIESVTTFNSAGFIATSELIFQNLEFILGLGQTEFYKNHHNYFAEHGINVTTNDWWFNQVGNRKELFNEKSPILKTYVNHSMYKLTDTLALGNVLATFDQNFTIKQLNDLLNGYAKLENGKGIDATLETALDSVRKIFFGNDIQDTPISDSGNPSKNRETYHANIKDLLSKVNESSGKMAVFSSIDDEFNKIVMSENGTAYRYALKNLNLFAIEGADYSQHNQNGELDLYSEKNPNGLTQIYLEKRAKMLSVILDKANGKFQTDDYSYQDLNDGILVNETSLDTRYGNVDIDKENTQIIFGGTGNDTIKAKDIGDNNNFLFGGSGNDILDGGKGNDYLEGGVDFDTYHIKDHDIIYDADGKGKILFDGKQLPKDFIRHLTTNIWYAKDNKGNILYTAIKDNNDLTITSINSPNDKATLKDFFTTATKRGNTYSALSIVLADTQEDANKQGAYTIKADDKYLSNIHTDGFPSNYLDIYGSSKVDNIVGTGKKYLTIDAGDGNDLIIGSDMADVIKGGAGNDVIYGSSGFYDFEPENSTKLPKPETDNNGNLIGVDKDLIIGGTGNDLILSGIGDDVIWADDEYEINIDVPVYLDPNNPNNAHVNGKGDWMLGGRGNDIIHGSTNKDFLQGGGDSDTIYGGGGDDVILGDGHIRFEQKSKTISNPSSTDYETIIEGNIHPLVPNHTYHRPVFKQGDTLSIGYRYDKDKDKYVQDEQPSVHYREPVTFEWNIKIDYKNQDYILTLPENTKLTYNHHLLPKEHTSTDTQDHLYGGKGNDLIIGQYGDDYLDGGEGNDILWGDDNRDLSISGSDFLNGGTGRDTLIGGLGFDTYDFKSEDLRTYGSDDKIIRDEDNQGRIVIDGKDWTGKVWTKDDIFHNVYYDGEGNTLIKNGSDHLIKSKHFEATIVLRDFSVGFHDELLGMKFVHERVNTPPYAPDGVGNQKVLAGQDVNINLSNTFVDLSDPEDKLIYSLTGLSNATGLGFDQTLKSIIGTAPESGVFHLTLSATDTQGLTGNTNFTLGVNEKSKENPDTWEPVTLIDWMPPRTPTNKVEGVNFDGTTNTRTSLMADESNTSTATTETTLPTLKQLGLVKEEEIGVDMSLGLAMNDINHSHNHHNISAPTPEPTIIPTHNLMMDKVQEVGVMGV